MPPRTALVQHLILSTRCHSFKSSTVGFHGPEPLHGLLFFSGHISLLLPGSSGSCRGISVSLFPLWAAGAQGAELSCPRGISAPAPTAAPAPAPVLPWLSGFLTFVPLLSLTAAVQCFLLSQSSAFPHSCSTLELSGTGASPSLISQSHPCSPLTIKTICLFGLQCLLNTHSFVLHPQ